MDAAFVEELENASITRGKGKGAPSRSASAAGMDVYARTNAAEIVPLHSLGGDLALRTMDRAAFRM